MKQKQLLRTLLAAVCLLVGTNAWGATTAFSQDFTAVGESTNPSDYGFTLSYGSGSSSSLVNFTVTDGVLHCSMNNNTGGGRTGTATATFSSIGIGNEIVVSYKWFIGDATGNTNGSHTETYIGNSSGKALDIKFVGSQNNGTLYVNGVAVKSENSKIRSTTYTVTATLNMNTKKITTLTLDNSNNTFDYTATDPIDFASDISTIDRFSFENSTRQNWVNTATLDDVIVTYEESKEPVGSFVLNYTYDNAVIASENIATDGLYVGDSYTVPFRMYVQKDGALYKTTYNDNKDPGYYRENITLTANTIVNKALTPVDLNGGELVLLEDLDDTNGENAQIRASYGLCYNNKAYTSATTLAPGIYTFIVKALNKGRGSSIKVGDITVATIRDITDVNGNETKGAWTDKTFSNIEVPVAGNVTLAKGGSTIDCYDIIIAIRTGDYTESKTISTYGYATFSSKYPVNVNVNGLEAYVVTGNNESSITTEKITGDVAANTGLILKGNAGTYSLPVVASGTTYNQSSDPKNYLFACDGSFETVNAATTGTNYVLTVQEEKVVFAPIRSTSATVEAGQAALWLPASVSAKALTLSFGDDVTGIEAVSTVEPQGAKTYYNLQGQRVSEPKQGIYVVDGKKVLVK